jgi:hypothetical protein
VVWSRLRLSQIDSRLVLGNEIVGEVVKGYEQTATYKARQHTVAAVGRIMSRLALPLAYAAPTEISESQQVFIGYVMLDALVANQDRHHHNWGVILSPDQLVTLAPTFDHASSLGRNETDEARLRRLQTKDLSGNIAAYCKRARSAFYPLGGEKLLSTLDAFIEAAKLDAAAARYWLNCLQQISPHDLEQIVGAIPASEMSEPARLFALAMLEENRRRLLGLHI